jgi:hypothetical protein
VKAPKTFYVILLLLVLLPFSAFSQPPSKPDKSGKEAQLPSANIPEKYKKLIEENEKYFETVKEGKDYVPGERILVFAEGVSGDEAVQIAREAGAKEVKPVAPGKTKLVMSLAKFESEEAAQAAEKAAQEEPEGRPRGEEQAAPDTSSHQGANELRAERGDERPAPTLPVVARQDQGQHRPTADGRHG